MAVTCNTVSDLDLLLKHVSHSGLTLQDIKYLLLKLKNFQYNFHKKEKSASSYRLIFVQKLESSFIMPI